MMSYETDLDNTHKHSTKFKITEEDISPINTLPKATMPINATTNIETYTKKQDTGISIREHKQRGNSLGMLGTNKEHITHSDTSKNIKYNPGLQMNTAHKQYTEKCIKGKESHTKRELITNDTFIQLETIKQKCFADLYSQIISSCVDLAEQAQKNVHS